MQVKIVAARAGKTPVVIADHADRTGNSTHILEALIQQEASNFCIATIADKKCIDLEDCDIISLKTRVHFRRGFHETGLAGAIFEVDTPGLGPADLTTLEYENVPKDLYPLNKTE